ncbi:signal peptidase I [Kitasatospora sp. NPDC057223]|uniref:signal peptidase I n=1 Tax=Kitasatospora sp. NPDC057223 TaxID=3346055 RepID=UPI00363132B4
MSKHEPFADRDGRPAPTGADDMPSRSAAVSEADAAPRTTASDSELPRGAEAGLIPGPDPGAPGDHGAKAAAKAGADVGAVTDAEAGADIGAATGADDAADAPDDDAGRGGWRPRDLFVLAGVCLLVLLSVNAFVARPFGVPSGSMENTLHPGDRLVANQLAYAFGGHVRRGDVVVFDGTGSFLPEAPKATGVGAALRGLGQRLGVAPAGDTVYVKRVIGVGGDRVTSPGPGGPLTVNGVPLDESAYLETGDESSTVAFDVIVPAGKLWVMGDHRRASRDSRDHIGEPGGGFVPESKVIGRADWVVYPIGHWTSLDRPASSAVSGGTGGHGNQG